MSIPSYITIPQAASPIDGPGRKSSSRPVPPPPRARLPSFPPSSSTVPPPPRKFSVPSTSSLSTNVSDMLLSSLLPPNLPKIPQAKTAGGPGRPRELSSQRELLSLPLMSNNFRRFITKVGPVFWLQDRFEEALFWRKPKWTWTYLLFWTCVSFKPKLLLLLPSATLLLILLHIHERTNPLPSLLGVALGPTPMGTARVTANVAQGGSASSPVVSSSGAFTSSTGVDGEVIPVVPPKEAESGVDFFMNMQAIQNLMGLISDMYDSAAPFIQHLTSPTSSPTAFPITLTHVILLLLPPTLLLPLIPNSFLPFLLLPIGYIPPLLFHPNLTPFVLGLSRNPAFLKLRSLAEKAILTDELSDEIGRCQIGRVEVFENERLDPSIVSKQSSSSTTTPVALPPGSWSSKHLRAGERAPWVKILEEGNSLWSKSVEGTPTDADKKDGERMVLALEDNWEFIPNDEWRVDVCGLWSDLGTDEDGWSYSDDSWQNPGPAPFSDAETPSSDKQALPGLALRRITRRRRWWRRVYLPSSSEK